MEAMLGISLYSYLYLKLAKTLCMSYYHLCFLFNKIREEDGRQVLPGSRGLGVGGKVAQTMYTHVSKCKNDKRRKKKLCCNVSDQFTDPWRCK
jgi:hypothetical protein